MTRLLPAALGLLLLAAPAAAQPAGIEGVRFALEFADSSGQAASSFAAPLGGTVDVRVYLRVTADPSGAVAADGGLGSAGLRFGFDPPPSPLTAGGVSVTAAANGPAWDTLVPPDLSAAGGTQGAAVFNLIPAGPGGAELTGGRVLLGTVTVHADQVGFVTLSAGDPNPANGSDFTSFTSGYNFDPQVAGSQATFEVQPVPEPAGVVALAAAGGWIAGRRRRARLPAAGSAG